MPVKTPSGERLADTRYRRFGIVLGVVAALLIHGAVFLIPSSTVTGKKETERGMVARAVRTKRAVQEAPPGGSPGSPARETRAEPRQNTAPAPIPAPQAANPPSPQTAAAVQSTEAPEPAVGLKTSSGAVAAPGPALTPSGAAAPGSFSPGAGQGGSGRGTGQTGVGQGTGAAKGDGEGTAKTGDWDKVLALLDTKRKELETKRTAESEARASARKVEEKTARQATEKFLDPRIRMTVTSYPASAIEENHPPVSYPEARFTQSQIAAGTCRVYYRVWTDKTGKIMRTEIKTPASAADREKYKMFVDSVVEGVTGWRFPPVEAQVHIDVLFEIR